MGCNTSKEAVAPADDTTTSAEQQPDAEEKGEKTETSPQPAEEEIDIDLNDPQTAKAATKIQAVFRGHKTRKTMKTDIEATPELSELEKEFRSDDKELCHAATKIQASFRGHMSRKVVPKGKEEDDLTKELQKLEAKAEEEELDIDLTDPDLHKAATKIQASFRGHKVRKENPDDTAAGQ